MPFSELQPSKRARPPQLFVLLAAASLFLTAVLFTLNVGAQTYPSKPIRVIIPYAAGSSTDLTARQIMTHMGASLGQPIFFENIVGAVGIIGTEALVRAPADGYTLAVTSNIHSMLPSLFSLSFDPIRDITPITMLGLSTMVLVVHPKVAANTTKEFIALAKSKPEALTMGSTGNGSVGHLAIEMLGNALGSKFLHVPYKANAGLTTDLVGGQIDAGFVGAAAAMQLVRSGKLRAIAVTSTTRSPALPDVPTLDESGVQGFEIDIWAALIAPAGTPPSVVSRLQVEAQKAMSLSSVQSYFREQSVDLVATTAAQTAEIIQKDASKYAIAIKKAGIKMN